MFVLLYVVMTMSSVCLFYFICYDNEFCMFVLLYVVMTMSSVCLSYLMLL